ncbi:MAG TPA: winged helix-turn-helix transcriptional regulator [Pseudonocardiaceae bacterium]|jgi:DNA-binding HxlR family transcriptional regulator|nr:winged helix-turn-helix transcriptional regulator [Pseudonocardiaceae bacterium]
MPRGESTKRSYQDPCGTARALDVIGERWAVLVVRELLFGPKRFTDLSRGLPGMSQNVLSQRLRELAEAGVLRRTRLGPPAGGTAYELTQRGRALEPILLELGRWGSRVAADTGGELSVDALVFALRTTFDARSAGRSAIRVELRFAADRFRAEIGEGTFQVARGGAAEPDATLDTDPGTLRSIVFGGRPLAEAVQAGDVRLAGDQRAATRFTRCFPRPTPFPAENDLA